MIKRALLAVLLLTAISATAQRSLRFGLTGSSSVSWIKPDTKGISNDGVSISTSYGFMMDLAIAGSENYALTTGFNISDLKGKVAYPTYETFDLGNGLELNTIANSEGVYKLRYLEIPALLKMKTNEIGYFTYFGQIGLVGGVRLRSLYDGKSTATGTNTEKPYDNEDATDIRLFRAALSIGGGLEWNLSGNTSLMGCIRYQNGFANILKGDYYEIDNNSNVKLDTNGDPITGPKKRGMLHQVELAVGIIF